MVNLLYLILFIDFTNLLHFQFIAFISYFNLMTKHEFFIFIFLLIIFIFSPQFFIFFLFCLDVLPLQIKGVCSIINFRTKIKNNLFTKIKGVESIIFIELRPK